MFSRFLERLIALVLLAAALALLFGPPPAAAALSDYAVPRQPLGAGPPK